MSSSLEQCVKPGNLIHGIPKITRSLWETICTEGLRPAVHTGKSELFMTKFPYAISFTLLAQFMDSATRYYVSSHRGPQLGRRLDNFRPLNVAIVVNAQKVLDDPNLSYKLITAGKLFHETKYNRNYPVEEVNGRSTVFGITIGKPSDLAHGDEVQLKRLSQDESLTPQFWAALVIYCEYMQKLAAWNQEIGGPVADLPIFGISPNGDSFLTP